LVGSRPEGQSTALVTAPDLFPNFKKEGEYVKDIEINDLKNRYLLTKGQAQYDIKKITGADVVTRGKYWPNKSMATDREPPLYLHITSPTAVGLRDAIRMIDDLINKDLGSLVDERRFGIRKDNTDRDELGRRKWPEKKVLVGLEPLRGFNVRAQVVGQQGAYVKHIAQETRTRVQIKGRNSGFIEPAIGRESDEPMYLHITGPEQRDVEAASVLVDDLLETVRENYEAHQHPEAQYEQPQPQQQEPMRFPGFAPGQGYPEPAANPYGMAPGAPGIPGMPDMAAPGVASHPGQDPYAAYGGYQNYMAYYAYYQQQQMQGGQVYGGAPGQV